MQNIIQNKYNNNNGEGLRIFNNLKNKQSAGQRNLHFLESLHLTNSSGI